MMKLLVRKRVERHAASRVSADAGADAAADAGVAAEPAPSRAALAHHRNSPRLMGSFVYILILCGLEIVVTAVLALVLLDFAIGGSMREAMRYTVLDAPGQMGFIAVALVLACAAVRFAAEANIELVLPELFDTPGNIGRFASLLPRALAFLVGWSIGYPMIRLALDELTGSAHVLDNSANGYRALFFGFAAIAIGFFTASIRGLHAKDAEYSTGRSSLFLRLALALIPLTAMVALTGTVLGLFPGDIPGHFLGIAPGAVERYSAGEDATYHMAVEGAALFLTAIVLRAGFAILFGLLSPRGADDVRTGLASLAPRVAAALVGFAAAYQLSRNYAGVTLTSAETQWFYGIASAYIAIAVLASLVVWPSSEHGDASHASHRLSARWRWAADRVAGRPGGGFGPLYWICPLIGAAVFLFFVDTTQVARAQTIGPIAVLLLWGFTATVLFAPIAYLSQMTKMPLLLILLIAGVAFAGFDLNDNHQIRGASTWHSARHHTGDPGYYREHLELGEWLKSRHDWRAYDHYPIFLVATEGGGIRAAYFTATVLAALEQKCPGFAQHVIALSSVSGGSVGSAVFAGQSADATANTDAAGCTLSAMKPGAELTQARAVLSTDLLSPLLGASLFPDALQRILPMPVRSFDRARALEYALEDGWRSANTGCKGCDPERMSEPVASMYQRGEPRAPVPHLFLNTTEAGTGLSRPFATWDIGDLAVPERSVTEEEKAALPHSTLVPVQNRMRRDDVALSTASMLSARFPYLTPAAKLGNTGHYVDGGYFENSGTWLLSGIAQNLIGQRLDYTSSDQELEQAVQNSILVVIVIRSEPCTRKTEGDGCDEEIYKGDADSTWNEVLSPLRALLATRDKRSEYSVNDLGAVTALIQRLTGAATVTTSAGTTGPAGGMQCNEILCSVTIRFYNAPGAEVPLTWMLSSKARQSMDNAVQRILDEDLSAPPRDIEKDDRIEGSYRQVLCLLEEGTGKPVCPVAPDPAAAVTSSQPPIPAP